MSHNDALSVIALLERLESVPESEWTAWESMPAEMQQVMWLVPRSWIDSGWFNCRLTSRGRIVLELIRAARKAECDRLQSDSIPKTSVGE
ncbi:MAG: hypothetical protein EBR82_50840 [Caulobacteraceae bacterium]|nr:hypothetical protein [Caulobacteraceae bacterium]